MKAHRSKLLWISILTGITPLTYAGTMGQIFTPVDFAWQPVFTLSLGPAWNTDGKTQTIYLEPDVAKTYAATNNSQPFLNAEFFLGAEKVIYPNIKGQLGLSIAGTSNAIEC